MPASLTSTDPATFLRLRQTPEGAGQIVNIHEHLRKARRAQLALDRAGPAAIAAEPPSPSAASIGAQAVASAEATGASASARSRLGSAIDRLRQLAASQGLGNDFGPMESDDDDPSPIPSRNSARRPQQSSAVEEFSGTLSNVRAYNDWALGTVWTSERESRKVMGATLIGLTEGLEYTFSGTMKTHATHGDSLDVSVATPTISNDDLAIGRFLEKTFTGIGKAKAEKFIKQTRAQGGEEAIDQLRRQLLEAPWDLDLTSMAGNASFAEGEDPMEQARLMAVARNLMLRLGGPQGLREGVAKDLASWLIAQTSEGTKSPEEATARQPTADLAGTIGLSVIDQTWAKLALNPYAPISAIKGYGFASAEAVASIVGTPVDDPFRLGALAAYACREACERQGHTYLTSGDFRAAMQKADPRAPIQKAMIEAIRSEQVVVDEDRIYPHHLFHAEKKLAKELAALMRPGTALTQRRAEDLTSSPA